MRQITFSEIKGRSASFYTLAATLGVFFLLGLTSAGYAEHVGHYVTGANNQVTWGIADVFAMLLIVSASGALNVAIISSVFGKTLYRPLERLACLLAIALLLGGLLILMLDLGRPDRVMVAALNHNFKSIFAWNLYLYTGFITVVVVYLWAQMEPRMSRFIPAAGLLAFTWRIVLTTGSGSIYGVLSAREAWGSAIMGPLFIAMSCAFGLAIFILVLLAACHGSGREIGDVLLRRLVRLLGIFIVVALYFTTVQHLSNQYAAGHAGFERFILRDGGIYPLLFWGGQIILGALAPLGLVFWSTRKGAHPGKRRVALASVLVMVGAFAQLYVIIIGGQAWPLNLFPGMEVSSSFYDGSINSYHPGLPAIGLGLGGVALAGLLVLYGLKLLRFLPATLANAAIDPQHKAAPKSA